MCLEITPLKFFLLLLWANELTHWGRVMHTCVSQLITIVSDNGLLPDQRQAFIWNNDGILLLGPVGRNFSEILIENLYIFIQENAFENVVWKMAAILSRSQCVNRTDLYINNAESFSLANTLVPCVTPAILSPLKPYPFSNSQ